MPVKSTASKSVTAPKARKTRTRKTNTRTAKAVATPQKVTATVKKVKSVSKIRTLKTVKRPSTARLITPSRYWSDIQTRWQIHNYEITMLVSDLTKGLKYVRQFTN